MTARRTGSDAPRRIDLDAALRHLRRDPHLAPLVRAYGRPPGPRRQPAFAALGRSILHQQLTGRAAATILRRFTSPYPRRRFPTPAEVLALEAEDFRRAGVSRQKARYLVDLARHFDEGLLSGRRFPHQEDEELERDLTRVLGIGEWTVHMFQIGTLGRPDVLPVGDLGIQKGLQRLHALDQRPAAATMRELAEPWRPWRSVASWYLWRLADEP